MTDETHHTKLDVFDGNADAGISDRTGTGDIIDALIGLIVGTMGVAWYINGHPIYGSLVTILAIFFVAKLFAWDRVFGTKYEKGE